jgi:hypothetical protein
VKKEETFDVKSMYNPTAVEEPMVDDASGRIKMWYVHANDKHNYPSEMFGHFFTEDSYILLYTYQGQEKLYETSQDTQRFKDKFILYFWQGRRSGFVSLFFKIGQSLIFALL